MMPRQSCALILSALMLTACGGSGGGAAPSLVKNTPITGTVTPPVAASGVATARANMVLPAASTGTWPSIVQGADYTIDPATLPTIKIASMNIKSVDTQTGSTTITTDAQGQTIGIQQTTSINYSFSTVTYGATLLTDFLVPGLPTIAIRYGRLNTATVSPNPGTLAAVASGYIAPYSATLNPAGYTYQTFGYWGSTNTATGLVNEYYFSTGAPTSAATLPTTGTATYTGHAAATYMDAVTRELLNVAATMNATANFASLSVAFSTTGSTTVAVNSPVGAPTAANPGLNLNGTLNYATGSNTFTGTVTTANGMTGNATGRFYGPGIATATTTKAAGSPPEIGGTFAVMGTAGAMQGAFGGK